MSAVAVALRRGLVAFVVVALAGQLIPALIDLFGGGLAAPTARVLGWFYMLEFHRVALDVHAATHDHSLSIAFLTGTGLALWLLYRGGRAAASRAGDSLHERVLVGAMVAPAYAVPIGLITAVTHLQLAIGGGVRVHGVLWQAFVFPLVIAACAGGAGGAAEALPFASRGRAWLAGGWNMLMLALGLAFVGVLALAAVRPAGLRTYARGVSANGPRVAVLILGHHALLIPNQSLFVLVPSMGGCVSLDGDAETIPLLCPGRLPDLETGIPTSIEAVNGGGVSPGARPMPVGYWAFLLIPAVAALVGGRWAAGEARGRERLVRGGGAGLVFGVLVGCGALASLIRVDAITLGPSPAIATALGMAWGIGGGALGALLPVAQAEGAPVPEPAPAEPAGPPPNPTSV